MESNFSSGVISLLLSFFLGISNVSGYEEKIEYKVEADEPVLSIVSIINFN